MATIGFSGSSVTGGSCSPQPSSVGERERGEQQRRPEATPRSALEREPALFGALRGDPSGKQSPREPSARAEEDEGQGAQDEIPTHGRFFLSALIVRVSSSSRPGLISSMTSTSVARAGRGPSASTLESVFVRRARSTSFRAAEAL